MKLDRREDLIAEAPEDTQPDDGGPAFPGEQGHCPDGTWNQTHNPGMSLREWYAGMALIGAITERTHRMDEMAAFAFMQADEMIKASRK